MDSMESNMVSVGSAVWHGSQAIRIPFESIFHSDAGSHFIYEALLRNRAHQKAYASQKTKAINIQELEHGRLDVWQETD